MNFIPKNDGYIHTDYLIYSSNRLLSSIYRYHRLHLNVNDITHRALFTEVNMANSYFLTWLFRPRSHYKNTLHINKKKR